MTAESDVDLEGLSDVEAMIDFTDFTNPKDFTKTLQAFFHNAYDRDSVGDHTLLITAYPNKCIAIDELDDNKLSLIPRSRKALYFQDSQILLLTMPERPHEIAARTFDYHLALKLDKMGCYEDIVPSGRATTLIGNVKKEPDASWGPLRAGTGPKYATCVLECAVSEGSGALSRDAKLWLEHDDSHVTQVITVKIYRRPEIVFTVWTRASEQQDTRADHPLRAVVDQEIRITLQAGRPVADGMLCLSFEKIFERQPRPGTAEGDFNFSARELGGIARMVWSEMGFEIE